MTDQYQCPNCQHTGTQNDFSLEYKKEQERRAQVIKDTPPFRLVLVTKYSCDFGEYGDCRCRSNIGDKCRRYWPDKILQEYFFQTLEECVKNARDIVKCDITNSDAYEYNTWQIQSFCNNDLKYYARLDSSSLLNSVSKK